MKDRGLWFWPYESAITKDRTGQRIDHSEGVTEIKDNQKHWPRYFPFTLITGGGPILNYIRIFVKIERP